MKHQHFAIISLVIAFYPYATLIGAGVIKRLAPSNLQQPNTSLYQKQLHKPPIKKFNSNVLVCSIPKCGTHLLTMCLHLLTGQKGSILPYLHLNSVNQLPVNNKEFLYFHVYYTPETSRFLAEHNFKGLFIYRDPRDQIVSRAYWVLKHPEIHPQYLVNGTSISSIIKLLIPDTVSFYNLFLGWKSNPLFYSIKFENLVGPKGGGTAQLQLREIHGLANHLGLSVNTQEADFCVKNLFGNTATFRKGQIGGWRQYFTKEDKDLCKKHLNNLLVSLEYEKDLNW